jgi:succinoglycan biosynthesis protein ExoL
MRPDTPVPWDDGHDGSREAGPADSGPRIAYFVQMLQDDAVRRRVMMFESAGARVQVLGFSREAAPPRTISNAPVHCIGYTHAGAFLSRIAAVFAAIASVGRWARAVSSADIVVARNLECLAVAAFATRRLRSRRPLYYEVLDIHRLMLRSDIIGMSLRALERTLMRRCAGVITSSPAYQEHYFARFHPGHPRSLLVENKVFWPDSMGGDSMRRSSAIDARSAIDSRPIVIGWFGFIRCQRSLDILKELTARYPGRFEVHIRGKVAETAVHDFHQQIRGATGLQYFGPYRNPEELAAIYSGVDLAWMVDFFDEGRNAPWALANRLYEGGLFGAVGVALDRVQSGRWLREHDAGITLRGNRVDELVEEVASIQPATIAAKRERLLMMDKEHFLTTPEDCRRLVDALEDPDRSRQECSADPVRP